MSLFFLINKIQLQMTLLLLLNLKHCSSGSLVSLEKRVWIWLIPRAEPAALITFVLEHKWCFHSIYQEITQGRVWFSPSLFFSSVSPALFDIYTFKENSTIVFNMLSVKRPLLVLLFRPNMDTIHNTRERLSWGVLNSKCCLHWHLNIITSFSSFDELICFWMLKIIWTLF